MLSQKLKGLGYSIVRFGERFDNKNVLTLAGDRDLEWSWVIAKAPNKIGRVLDVGPGNSTTPLALSFIAKEVVALDLNAPENSLPLKNVRYVIGDIMTPPSGLGQFELVINCSTIEHIGIPGRYGSKESTDGDLVGMANLRGMMSSDAQMLLTIPVGVDGVYAPNHRVYGETRLPKLLSGYKKSEEKYFGKTANNPVWHEQTISQALSTKSSGSFYSIGLFVLTLA